MAAISFREVRVDGVRSLVRLAGPQDAPEAVVFVHGNPGSGEDFTDLLARVGDFARAIAPDMPGFGKADRPEHFEYTVPAYARHLAGLLSALGIQRAHLVLHDFGGPFGLWWASEHPDSVLSVTLFNIGVMRGYRWHKYARIWQTPILGELFQLLATRRATRAILNAENPKPFPAAFVERMLDDADWGMKRAVLRLYRNTRDIATLSQTLADRLKPLHLPALVVWGKGDRFLHHRFAEAQREYFDVEAVHMLPECGHWPFIDEPERVAELVLPFLQRRMQGRLPGSGSAQG